jgi:hypothetical protein
VAALLVEPQPNSRVPRRVVCSGSWVARTSQTRTSVIERRERTKPHTLLYVRFHFAERRDASFLVAALASVPLNPSTKNMRGVKVRRRARKALTYLSFFSFSCLARIL